MVVKKVLHKNDKGWCVGACVCMGGYTETYAVYLLDFLKQPRIPPISQVKH